MIVLDDKVKSILNSHLENNNVEKISNIIEDSDLCDKYETDEKLIEFNKYKLGKQFATVSGSRDYFLIMSDLGLHLLRKIETSFTKKEFLTTLIFDIIDIHIETDFNILYYTQKHDFELTRGEFLSLNNNTLHGSGKIRPFLIKLKRFILSLSDFFEFSKDEITDYNIKKNQKNNENDGIDELLENEDKNKNNKTKTEKSEEIDDEEGEDEKIKDEAYEDFDDIFED